MFTKKDMYEVRQFWLENDKYKVRFIVELIGLDKLKRKESVDRCRFKVFAGEWEYDCLFTEDPDKYMKDEVNKFFKHIGSEIEPLIQNNFTKNVLVYECGIDEGEVYSWNRYYIDYDADFDKFINMIKNEWKLFIGK